MNTRTQLRSFPRSTNELDSIVGFTGEAFADLCIDASLRGTVDFVIEELFTNMVKYSAASKASIDIAFEAVESGVEVRLIDRDVAAFDVTAARAVDVGAPIDARVPGGLGLHLIRRMVDEISYEYVETSRESRIRFRKYLPGGSSC